MVETLGGDQKGGKHLSSKFSRVKKVSRTPMILNEQGDGKKRIALSSNSAYDIMKNKQFKTGSALMRGIPNEVQEEVRRYAAMQLSLLWIPRVMLCNSKQKKRKELTDIQHDKLSMLVDLLKTSEILVTWPIERLQVLAQESIPIALQAGDVILHEGEVGGSGIWLLLTGRVVVTKKIVCGEKTKSGAKGMMNSEVLARIQAPKLLGDFALLTDEPRTASVILDEDTTCWTVPRAIFIRELELLSAKQQEQIYNRAFKRRQCNIVGFMPRTVNDLRSSPLLDTLDDHEREVLLPSLQPLCVRAGNSICVSGTKTRGIFFLCRGQAESINEHGDKVVHTPASNSTFGEMSFIFGCGIGRIHTRAIHHCDMWVLPFNSLEDALKFNSIKKALYRESAKSRLAYQRKYANSSIRINRCIDALKGTIITESCSTALLTEISKQLIPLAVLPQNPVLSAVDSCDKLFVLECGRAKVQHYLTKRPPIIKSGDVFGITLLAFHRWLFPVQAVVGCDVWYIEKDNLIQLLDTHQHYDRMFTQTRKRITEHEYLPLSLTLQRRFNKHGLIIPPTLHPIPGLPEGIDAPFHFDDKRQIGESRISNYHEPQGSRKCWIVLRQTVPFDKPVEHFPSPPKNKIQPEDASDLNTMLGTIKTPPRFDRNGYRNSRATNMKRRATVHITAALT